jgi:hypothetical protein
MFMLGPILEDDDTFLQVVELSGKRIEKIKRYAKARNFSEAKYQKTRQKKKKRPRELLTKIKTIAKKRKKRNL